MEVKQKQSKIVHTVENSITFKIHNTRVKLMIINNKRQNMIQNKHFFLQPKTPYFWTYFILSNSTLAVIIPGYHQSIRRMKIYTRKPTFCIVSFDFMFFLSKIKFRVGTYTILIAYFWNAMRVKS